MTPVWVIFLSLALHGCLAAWILAMGLKEGVELKDDRHDDE